MVPGSPFEGPGSVRIAYATSRELLEEAMDKIEKALTE